MKTLGTLVAALLLASGLSAQIAKPDFSDVSDMILRGSAVQTGTTLQITDTVPVQTGWAWFDTQQAVLSGFDTTFSFRITSGPVLAEGFAFVIQNSPTGTNPIPSQPWTIGYGGMPNSVAVEVDTFNDGFVGDTSANELTVHTRGMMPNTENESASIGRITPSFSMSDAQVHQMRVRYVPGTLEVFVDDLVNPLLSIPYSFQTGGNFLTGPPVGGLLLPNGTAWFGFSATTGGGVLNERVEILDWTLNSGSPVHPCFNGQVPDGAGDVTDTLFINGSAGDFFRRVTTRAYEPLSMSMMTPPTANGASMPFGIVGIIGEADGNFLGETPFGDMCFPVHAFDPTPITFTFTESFGLGLPSFAPSTPTPWNWAFSIGLPFPITLTMQGLLQTVPGDPASIRPTNAIVLVVESAPAPSVASIGFPSGVPGTPVTIVGENFPTNVTVTLNGGPVALISQSATELVFAEPALTGCDLPVVVSNIDGQSDSTMFNPSPVFVSSPNAMGAAAGNGLFVITGSGFAPGTTVTIGGNPAVILSQGSGVIVCRTPAGSVGPATVVIATPSGCSTTTTYTYL